MLTFASCYGLTRKPQVTTASASDYSATMHLIFAQDGTCYVNESGVKVTQQRSHGGHLRFDAWANACGPTPASWNPLRIKKPTRKTSSRKLTPDPYNVPCPMHELNTWWGRQRRSHTHHARTPGGCGSTLSGSKTPQTADAGLGQLLEFPSAARRRHFPDEWTWDSELYELLLMSSLITKRKRLPAAPSFSGETMKIFLSPDERRKCWAITRSRTLPRPHAQGRKQVTLYRGEHRSVQAENQQYELRQRLQYELSLSHDVLKSAGDVEIITPREATR